MTYQARQLLRLVQHNGDAVKERYFYYRPCDGTGSTGTDRYL
jgi:hypothetical protein